MSIEILDTNLEDSPHDAGNLVTGPSVRPVGSVETDRPLADSVRSPPRRVLPKTEDPVRRKIFVMSMGLAASVWLTGCGATSSSKVGARGTPSMAKSTRDGKGSINADQSARITQAANRLTTPSSIPAAACSTCAKSSSPGDAESASKSDQIVAVSCGTCDAKTGAVAVREPVILEAPSAPMTPSAVASLPPNQTTTSPPDHLPHPADLPSTNPSAANAVRKDQIVQSAAAPQNLPASGVGYGAGVDVVGSPTNDSAPVVAGDKAIANKVASVRIGQINDYKAVVGQVYQFRRAWKLRFAAVESDDIYGGSFTLVGSNLEHLKDGQTVRVEGTILPSEDRVSAARYQVSRIEILEGDAK
jgi:hypothetical protein